MAFFVKYTPETDRPIPSFKKACFGATLTGIVGIAWFSPVFLGVIDHQHVGGDVFRLDELEARLRFESRKRGSAPVHSLPQRGGIELGRFHDSNTPDDAKN